MSMLGTSLGLSIDVILVVFALRLKLRYSQITLHKPRLSFFIYYNLKTHSSQAHCEISVYISSNSSLVLTSATGKPIYILFTIVMSSIQGQSPCLDTSTSFSPKVGAHG